MSAVTSVPARPRPDARTAALIAAVTADPTAPRRIAVQAPGGYGKSALLRDLARVYRQAGVQVVDMWCPPVNATGPAVVFADDAHLLGEDRLRRLQSMVDQEGRGLVLACRPWPRPAGLAELRRQAGPPVTLCAFTEREIADRIADRIADGVADRIGTDADPELVAFVHAETSGVPRLVDRLAPALAWPSREIPRSVLAQFQADLDHLDGELRRLLLAVATNVELTGELLGALLDRDPQATDELLESARATGLLDPGGALVPLARRAVAVLSPAAHRSAVWQRVAELQLARGGTVLPLVRSLRELGVGSAGLAGVFETAADEALPEEPALAAELFAATAATATGRAGGARRALAAALAGDLDLGLRLADPLIAAASGGDRAASGGDRATSGGDRAAGAAVAAAALAHRGQLARSAELYRWSGTAASLAFATIAELGTGHPERDGQPVPDGPPTLLTSAAALMARGVRETVTGSSTTALSTLVQAAALLEPAGRAVLLPDSPAALAALVALHSGELEVGESVLERAVVVQMGARLMSRRHMLLRAWIHMVRGRTTAAAELRRAGAGVLEPRDLLFATTLEVGIARRNSDLAGMLRAWGTAREAVMRVPVDLFALLPLGELSVAAARLGEQARLAPHLREAQQLLGRLGNPPLWAAPLHWCGVHAAILAEEPATADQHVAALSAMAPHSRFGAVLATAAEAWVEVLRGTVDADAVETAARGLHGVGLSWDAARLAGQAAIRTSDRRAMTRLLDCARALQGRPAAPPQAGAADSPARPPGAAASSPRLSGREQEVAALLLDGLTYKQIGDRLFISAKTVEHHVARMRQRLGCASRSDLLARLRAMSGGEPGGDALRRPPWPRRPAD